MGRMVLRRSLQGVLTLLLVCVLVFVGTEILPGDVAEAVLGQSATPESLAALRLELGLDRPAGVRFAHWLLGIIQLDFGKSLSAGVPVSALIADRIGKTLLLAGSAAVIAVPLALFLGLAAAMRAGGVFDRAVSVVALCLTALPEFFLATLLVLIFSIKLQWLPAISYVTDYSSIGKLASSLAMPVATLAAVVVAQMARMTRAAVLHVLREPFIEMAKLKGLSRTRIVFVHALRNAWGPIVNVIALNLAYLVSGVVIVETVFAYPGLARLVVDAVASRDYPLIQACAIIFCTVYVILTLVADIVAILSNPRLQGRR